MQLLKVSVLLVGGAVVLAAQPTMSMFQRVAMIQTGGGHRGTAFAVDVDGREYWVTARHILTGAKGKPFGTIKEKTVRVQMLNPGGAGEHWISDTYTVLQPDEDVDIVVLVPPAATPIMGSPGPALANDVLFGGNCEFMGFPYGGGWRMKMDTGSYWVAYAKKCSISGMDVDARLWILDGINNKGFSGGPVFMGTGNNLKIIAVVSGYWQEPAEVIKGKPTPAADPKDTVNVNSGFILAYDIGIVRDLIKKNPIGPLRPVKK